MKQSEVFPQGLGQCRRMVHKGSRGGAPGQRFKTQYAAAGKQVEAVPACQVERQPVEQGLAGTGWCRADAASIGEAQLAASPVATNDA